MIECTTVYGVDCIDSGVVLQKSYSGSTVYVLGCASREVKQPPECARRQERCVCSGSDWHQYYKDDSSKGTYINLLCNRGGGGGTPNGLRNRS